MISPALDFGDGAWSYDEGTARHSWLRAAVTGARAAGIPWVVVGMHKPCLSLGRYVCDPGPDVVDLLLETGVDLVRDRPRTPLPTHQAVGAGPGMHGDPSGPASRRRCLARNGAGTTFVTVGTGGHELRAVNHSDSERRYFAASSGRNEEPSFGSLDVQVTADRLSARFVPVDGGTFTDRLVLTR